MPLRGIAALGGAMLRIRAALLFLFYTSRLTHHAIIIYIRVIP